MRVLVTGSRSWTDETVVHKALAAVAETTPAGAMTVVHGGARGADLIAAGYAVRCGFVVEEHLADWNRYGRRAGMIRNALMVKAGADLCLAFIRDNSPGATACAEMARRAGISVVVFDAPNQAP